VSRVFLLSPAHSSGERAQLLLSDRAQFDLAERVRSPAGAPLGEVFAFLSGLYFRGKLAYARAFARPPRSMAGEGALVITPNAGLLDAEVHVTRDVLRFFGETDIHQSTAAFRRPLQRDARMLASRLGRRGEAVLLGSIASDKYVAVLLEELGARLLFPPTFVGRGDMSRGGLMLRCARSGQELEYAPVLGAVRHGPRPPKLSPLRRR
jgi:hypothetical protein